MKLFNLKNNHNEIPSSDEANLNQYLTQLIDERDGKIYKTIKIGDQIIMAENLAYKPIIGIYYTYDEKHSKANKYGYLYDHKTAEKVGMGIKGWHLPTKEEFETIMKTLGEDPKKVFEALKSGGSTGFDALSGGYLSEIGTFISAGDRACFWTSSFGDANHAWGLIYDKSENEALLASFELNCGLSIRLFKDK